MTTPQRQPSSMFELEFPQSVGIYNSYADAQKAVDYLADEKFEVQNLAIVGTDLKSVERVLGRRSWGTVLAQAPDAIGIMTADLDLARLDLIREELPSLANRRLQ